MSAGEAASEVVVVEPASELVVADKAAGLAPVAPNLLGHFIERATELSKRDTRQYKSKTFLDFCSDDDVQSIIAHFAYPADGSTSFVVLNQGSRVEINAGTFNDYYKCTMAPVIRTVYDNKKCVVQFRVDWRFGSSFNSHMQNYVKTGGTGFKQALANKLNDFSRRKFTREMIGIETQRLPLDGGGSWKNFFTDSSDKWGIFNEKTLIASEADKQQIRDTYNLKIGEEEREIADTDFYDGTSILKFTPQPKFVTDFPIVVLSIVASESSDGKPDVRATGNWPMCSWLETPMMQACYEFLHTEYLNRTGISYGKWMAEALYRTFSGMCFLNDQPIKVALFSGRRTGGALFHLLQVWLWNKFSTPAAQPGGYNLGTSSFWALQTLEKLDIKPGISPTGTHAHELSMTLATLYPQLDNPDTGFVGTQLLGHILYSLISGGNGKVPLLSDTVATANFLKTACALMLPEFLWGKNESNCFTRFLAARQDSGELEDYKLLMMVYSALSGRATCPMLMASEIDDRDLDFIKAILLGIQLAGVGGALGDSEKIDALKVFDRKFKCRIDGHDDMQQDVLTDALKKMEYTELHFAASMAVKIVCVFVDEGSGPVARYTLKTGDATGKLTIDPEALDKDALKARGGKFQQLHNEALEACKGIAPKELTDKFVEINAYIDELKQTLKRGDPAKAASLEAPPASKLQDDYNFMLSSLAPQALESLPKFEKAAITVQQDEFTSLLEQITPPDLLKKFRDDAAAAAAGGVAALSSGQGVGPALSSSKAGGRRTRRRARKVTKKHVRKNIRKSKNKKSRRSYRRKSKK